MVTFEKKDIHWEELDSGFNVEISVQVHYWDMLHVCHKNRKPKYNLIKVVISELLIQIVIFFENFLFCLIFQGIKHFGDYFVSEVRIDVKNSPGWPYFKNP